MIKIFKKGDNCNFSVFYSRCVYNGDKHYESESGGNDRRELRLRIVKRCGGKNS